MASNLMKKAQLEELCEELLDVVNSLAFNDKLGRAQMEELGQELCCRYYDDSFEYWNLSKHREELEHFKPSKTDHIDDRYLVERLGGKYEPV